MKTKQEQIDEMAKVIQKIYITKISRNEYCLAQDIYEAGYRKASDVIDEFIEKITRRLNYDRDSELYSKTKLALIVNKIADEMRQEVEK